MKPLKTEVEFATPWFQILAKTMREGEPPYYSLKLPDYTSIVALTDDQQILIVRQYRPAVERYTLELPSGLVDPGETPAQTAHRELLEETGYDAANVEDLGPSRPDTGRLGNRIFTCVATGLRRVPRHERRQVRSLAPHRLPPDRRSARPPSDPLRPYLFHGRSTRYSGVAVTELLCARSSFLPTRHRTPFWTALLERPVASAIIWWLAATAPFSCLSASAHRCRYTRYAEGMWSCPTRSRISTSTT
jgi:8-oxo-dGTP pyrophosphatase MutT (NUDIX family)